MGYEGRGTRVFGHVFAAIFLVMGAGLGSGVAAAEGMEDGHEHHHHHHHESKSSDSVAVVRSQVAYEMPNVKMVRQDGQTIGFAKELDDGRPVIMNFIYTSCTAICPVTSQIMSSVQSQLAKTSSKVHLVSVSIDPEFDSPERLRAYAKSYDAQAQWQFYTGTAQASLAVQKAFDAYRGDKMNHIPVTFIRQAPGKPWVRLEGFASPERIVQEYQAVVGG
jgi:protein SCO1/2